jgi:hypothetical protein
MSLRQLLQSIGLVSALAVVALPAAAQGTAPAPMADKPAAAAPATGGGDAKADAEFAKWDKDKDGKISKAEAERSPLAAKFDAMDTDKDGSISKSEYAAGMASK